MQSNSLACSSSLHFHRVIVLQFATLNKGIAGFYDESSALWERMWGELDLAPSTKSIINKFNL